MSVAIAVRVFGSETLVALIRHYWTSPGSQQDAATTLDIPNQLVSTNTRLLLDAGVVIADPPARGRRPGRYVVDQDRVHHLLEALRRYSVPE